MQMPKIISTFVTRESRFRFVMVLLAPLEYTATKFNRYNLYQIRKTQLSRRLYVFLPSSGTSSYLLA
jgi:hypothetical protein